MLAVLFASTAPIVLFGQFLLFFAVPIGGFAIIVWLVVRKKPAR